MLRLSDLQLSLYRVWWVAAIILYKFIHPVSHIYISKLVYKSHPY